MESGETPTSAARRGLGIRLAVALGVSAAAGILADQLLADAVSSAALRAVVSAGTASTLVGIALYRMVVAPLSRSSQQLQQAYDAALADALRDPLTGLGNHRAFQEELDRQVEASQRYEVPLSLLLIDLDEFKSINDGRGHAMGDRALAHFGRVVSATVRRADRAFRVGGDEFAVLLPHTDAEGARVVGRRLLAEALQPTLRHDDEVSGLSFSAGIADMPELAATRAQLYSQADTALYAAKRAGRTDVRVFDPSSGVTVPVGGDGAAVVDLIARGQLHPVYQPIVNLATREVIGYEGLIRPMAPSPFANPAELFAAAAASGHLVALDLSCVEAIVAGSGAMAADRFLSINLSPTTVEAPEFSATAILGILARHGVAAQRVVLELTEQQPITDPEAVRSRLESCRSQGIRIAADDIGSGNAGLRLLSEMRFDVLKVDLSLVRRSGDGSPSSAVIESVVALASRTGALVIGEGIEEPQQLDQLAALGVSAGQGYLLGRPASLTQDVPQMTRPAPAVAPIPRDNEDGAAPMAAWRASIGLPAA